MSAVKVAVVQCGTVGGDTSATIRKVTELIAECGKKNVSIAVFPEALLGGYPKGADFGTIVGTRSVEGRNGFEKYWSQALEIPGAETAALGKEAKAWGLYLVVGVVERDGGTLYCTAIFIGPDGTYLGKHRKLVPTAMERIIWGSGDGSTLTCVDTPWGKVGAVICWENYMPLMRMTMYSKGVSMYCAITVDDRDSWIATMRHIALEGRCFVLSSCQYLSRKDFPPYLENRISEDEDHVLIRGGSVIVDPLGKILAGPDYDGETVLTADIDVKDIPRCKFDLDVTGHYARPDVFCLTVDERAKTTAKSVQE